MRFDPYKNFKFRLKWEGKYVAGVSEVSGLTPKRNTRERSTARKIPGLRKHSNLTLKRGVMADRAFERSLERLYDELVLELFNEADAVIASYRLIHCRITKIEAATLDAKANEVAIESLELECEGLENSL